MAAVGGGGAFVSLLRDAREEVSKDRKTLQVLQPKDGIIAKVLDFLEKLDQNGFDEADDFEAEHWREFLDYDIEEHRIEHKLLHEEFTKIFETKLEQFMLSHGHSADRFYETVRQVTPEHTPLWHRPANASLPI